MPLAVVTLNQHVYKLSTDPKERTAFAHALQRIIAEELSALEPESALFPASIEVRYVEVGLYDHNAPDFAVRIEAGDYPSRRKTLAGRTARIAERIQPELPLVLKGFAAGNEAYPIRYVWVRLSPCTYLEF